MLAAAEAAGAALEAPLADEQDRRVEARGAIAGSGMLTDPERIEALQAEAARRERAWRGRPKKGFASVLDEVEHPPELPPESQARGRGGRSQGDEATANAEATAEDGSGAAEEALERAATAVPDEVSGVEAAPPPALRRGPPDPRMAALHQLVDQRSPATPGEAQPPAAASSARRRRSKKGRGA